MVQVKKRELLNYSQVFIYIHWSALLFLECTVQSAEIPCKQTEACPLVTPAIQKTLKPEWLFCSTFAFCGYQLLLHTFTTSPCWWWSYLLGLGKSTQVLGFRMKYSSAARLMVLWFSFLCGRSKDSGVSTFGLRRPRYGGSMWMKICRKKNGPQWK